MHVRMLALAVFILPAAAFADQLPESDQRHTIRHTDLRYEMPEYASLEVWKRRAAFFAQADPPQCRSGAPSGKEAA